VRVSVTVASAGSVKRIITRQLDTISRRKMTDMGAEMVKQAKSQIRSEFDNSRAGARRRSPGTTHAVDALDWQLDSSTLPMTLRYRVKGGDAVVARIIFMNYGTSPHQIRPSTNWGGKGLGGPVPALERAARHSQSSLAWFEDGYWHVTEEVDHPGQDGVHFLEAARDAAVPKILHG
jgi:hypothetical protein